MDPRFTRAAACAVSCYVLFISAACSNRSGDLRTISGTVSGLDGTGLILALNATADGGSTERVSLVAGATLFSFATQLTEGSGYTVTVSTQPSSPPQSCSVSNGSGTLGSSNVADVAVACVTDSFSIGGTISGLEGSGLTLTLTDTTDDSASKLSVATGSTSFLFGTTIASGHTYAVTIDSAPVSPLQSCSVTNGSGTVSSADISDIAITCTTATNSISGTVSGTVPSSAVITVTLTSGDAGTVVDTTTASTSYGFASVATGTTYTVTPLAAGYTFTPSSATITLSGNNATQDFTAACSSSYALCGLGCCPKAVAISAGGTHTCAILYGGAVKCWGSNGSGQLGNNSTSNSLTPLALADSSLYSVITSGPLTAFTVSSTLTVECEAHTCGVTTSGTVKCWGSNTYGQLGDGSTSTRNTPTAIGDGSVYSTITVGKAHTCGIVADAGTAKCWGSNAYGQLGDGSTTNRLTPSLVSNSSFSAISAGMYHACSITAAGIAECWGSNSSGQLGDNSITDRHSPTATADSSSYSAIAASGHHSCGISASAIKCWGENTFGQLGDNSTTDHFIPLAVADSSTAYSTITAGGGFYCKLSGSASSCAYLGHTCGITTSGTTKCWGANLYGQLGDGTTTNRLTPTLISSTTYSAIAAGAAHTCGITLDAGTIQCWGANTYGQLGDGTTTNRYAPVDVQF